MKFFVFTKQRLLILGCCVIACILAVSICFSSYSGVVSASTTERKIPIYCVEKEEKVVSISFDADWGNEQTQTLLDILDNTLATQTWLSGDSFGVGDIAVAPFVYNLLETVKTWQPRPNLARWYQQLADRPAFREVVMIPVS